MAKAKITSEQKEKNQSLVHCGFCNEDKKKTQFNKSYNSLHTSGYLPYCKECINKFCYDNTGNVNLEKLKELLMLVDRPYLHDLFSKSCEESKNTASIIGVYFKNLGLPQNRLLKWKDSIFDGNSNLEDKDVTLSPTLSSSERNRLIEKFGFGYTDEELWSFDKKYRLLKDNYPEKTAMHTEALLTYVRYRVKEELSTARGDVGEATKWGALADKAAQNAKINPSQLSKADLSGGLNGFGELVRAVEQAVDIIPILPKFKKKPQDDIDHTLLCYINYVRRLKNLPDATYEEVWEFYNQRKKEYELKDTKGEE